MKTNAHHIVHLGYLGCMFAMLASQEAAAQNAQPGRIVGCNRPTRINPDRDMRIGNGLCEILSCTRIGKYLELNLPIRCTRESATPLKNDSLPSGFRNPWEKPGIKETYIRPL
jgi:hypothetical protein